MGDRVATALVLREAIWEKVRHGGARARGSAGRERRAAV